MHRHTGLSHETKAAVMCLAQMKVMGPVGRLVVVKTASGYELGRWRLSQWWVMRTKAKMAHIMG